MSIKRIVLTTAMFAVGIGIGAGIGAGASANSSHLAARPVPTVTMTVPAPGPTATVVQTVAPAAPAADTVLDTIKGSGTSVTRSFIVPDGGSYIVKWSYSGNTADGMGSNFALISADGLGLGLANEIAVSGSGSAIVSDVKGTTDRLQVQAAGSWTIEIVAAD